MATNKKAVKSAPKKINQKPAPAKSGAKQAKSATPVPVKKAAVKSPAKAPLKQPSKVAAPAAKKQATPIKKSSPLKNTAKPVTKQAVPKILNNTPKKNTEPAKNTETSKPTPPVAKNKALNGKADVKPVHGKADVKPASKPAVTPAPKKPETKLPEVKSLPKAKDIKVPAPKPLVLPKITSTRSRKYEPEFTKSVLDQPLSKPNGPSMRYSDNELNEFRELIQRKLETAKKELGYLQGLITRKDEMGGDDTDNRYMTMEDGSLSMEREQLSQMASRQITFIDHLEKAMMRIENKTYGICRVTGKLIDKARLRAVPHATLSIEAKMGIAK